MLVLVSNALIWLLQMDLIHGTLYSHARWIALCRGVNWTSLQQSKNHMQASGCQYLFKTELSQFQVYFLTNSCVLK